MMNDKNKILNMKIGSINCRAIYKQHTPTTSDDFVRYLKRHKFNILLCQETHIPLDTFEQTSNLMHRKFLCHESIWTQYCAIINFNSSISMTKVHESLDGRLILAKFTLVDNSIPLFYMLNLYAPAEHNHISKTTFFNNMITMIQSLPDFESIVSSLIVAGDFNYSFDNSSEHFTVTHPCVDLLHFVQQHFTDCFNPPGESFYDLTFKRGTSMSTIDYVFAGSSIHPHINDTHLEFMHRSWTDHALLHFTYTVGAANVGKGTWRADPALARNQLYIRKLSTEIDNYVLHKMSPTIPVQDQWDHIKRMVKKVTQNFCRIRAIKQQQILRDLQSDRNNILRRHRHDTFVLQGILPGIEAQIAKIQQDIAETMRLRAGKKWLEHNEKSADYLARTVSNRNSARNFQKIVHPVSGVHCEDTAFKLNATHTFYTDLYTAKPIDVNCLDTMLSHVHKKLAPSDAQSILSEISYDDVLEGSKRCPRKSSPGLDGLPYEILHLVIAHPRCREIVVAVYNEALLFARFPSSWQQACIALLPKKGDLTDLANWRPISLINTDCKVFTRLLNARIVPLASKLITVFQAGFMRNRFIGDHGLTNKLILEDAQKSTTSGDEYVGIMLDQTKAYDLIHPTYLAKVLEKFGFPSAFVQCIENLFFNNQIFVNMNGFLSPAVSQKRGLRQGDSISPLLFNFAIEPFIQSVLSNPDIRGYTLQQGIIPIQRSLNHVRPHHPVKLLAYADDVLIYIKSVQEFHALQDCLKTYNQASNSLINYNKSVAFPLTGSALKSIKGVRLQNYILQTQRMRWFDSNSTGHLAYLGFPIWFTVPQRESFANEMLSHLDSVLASHSTRSISMYAKARIANVLVLTKLWHVIRITPLPKAFFQQVKSRVHKFIYGTLFPKMRSSIFYLPKAKGGLGLLDAEIQQQVFQFRYIKAVLNPIVAVSTVVPSYLVHLLSNFLEIAYDAPSPALPLLFTGWRIPKSPRTLSPFFPLLFNALDTCFPARSSAAVWPKIPPAVSCLPLPINEVLYINESHNDSPFRFSKRLLTLKCSDIFYFDHHQQLLVFQPPAQCAFPGLSRKIRKAVLDHRLLAHPFFAFHTGLIPYNTSSTEEIYQTRAQVNCSSITIEPFVTTHLIIQDTLIPFCSNLTIRNQITRGRAPVSHGNFYNSNIAATGWAQFINNPMAPSARNLWYRLFQRKLSDKSSLAMIPGIVDSDRCTFCNMVETAEHMLFLCPHKKDIWIPILDTYLSNHRSFSLRRIYDDISNLRLESYLFKPLATHITIMDLFSVIMYHVWKAHWRHHFDSVPIVPIHIIPLIHKDLQILKKYYSL